MGLALTTKQFGYGWFIPKIDWEKLVFTAELSNQMAYSTFNLASSYIKQYAAVTAAKNDLEKLEAIGVWLSYYRSSEQIEEALLEFMTTIITRHFRKELFQDLKDELRPEFKDAAIAGNVMLCLSVLERVFLPRPSTDPGVHSPSLQGLAFLHITNAKRCKYKTVKEMVDFLWDSDDGQERDCWEHRGFRVLFQRASRVVQACCGHVKADSFRLHVKRTFILTNWVFPYPRKGKFFQHSKKKDRLWISVYHRDWQDRDLRAKKIEFTRLLRSGHDGPMADRHLEQHSTLLDVPRAHRAIVFMRHWDLVQDDRQCMLFEPQENPDPRFQEGIDMAVIKEELHKQWEEAETELKE
jgi:hypothetical protein